MRGGNMEDYSLLAEAIFGKKTKTIFDLEKQYPKRTTEGMVTRFAPSPTGFLHTGSLFSSFVNYAFAKRTNGVFYVRIEDTDQKREVLGSESRVFDELKTFGIVPSEGFMGSYEEGAYGPYKQSNRKEIYDICLRHLVMIGRAYPCFCTEDDMKDLRKEQEEKKIRTGYYGKYAKCRNLSVSEAIERINNKEPFVLRFKSLGNIDNHIYVHDEIRGDLALTQNDLDIVIMKSDQLPTYHFAHLVDDHFMRTTHVLRGEEWLPSLPIHIELFEAMGWEAPKYAHLPVIMKIDNGKRRKLSKRYDDEAAVSYFLEEGYPAEGIKEYLMTLANSNYEMWREDNPDNSLLDFPISFEKMSLDGALFDVLKICNLCKEYLSRLSKEEIASKTRLWASKYDKKAYERINSDYPFFEEMLSIERDKPNPRKDYTTYKEILPKLSFFYDDFYEENLHCLELNRKKEDILEVLNLVKDNINFDLDEESWVNKNKDIAKDLNYAPNMKEYKKNKEAYKGHFGDFMEIYRIALVGKKESPNLYYIVHILGKEKVLSRIESFLDFIKK